MILAKGAKISSFSSLNLWHPVFKTAVFVVGVAKLYIREIIC